MSVSSGATSLPRLASQTLNFEFGYDSSRPPSPLLLTGDGLFSLRLVLHIMGKRSRGPPPGTEERKAKRQRREYAFGEVEGMRQAGYRTWAVTPPVPENKRFSVVAQLVREFMDALQRHTGRRVQAKDEAAAHAMQRVPVMCIAT